MSLMCWREQHTADAECYLLVFACMRVYDDCMDELGGCVVLFFQCCMIFRFVLV